MSADLLADLRARALKAREFTHTVGECAFTVRTPTRQEVRQTALDHGLHQMDAAEFRVLEYHLAARAVVGWTGVRVRDLLPADGDPTPVPWSADAVALLLDAQPDWCDALAQALLARLGARNQALEDDAKNSHSTLPAPTAQAACEATP